MTDLSNEALMARRVWCFRVANTTALTLAYREPYIELVDYLDEIMRLRGEPGPTLWVARDEDGDLIFSTKEPGMSHRPGGIWHRGLQVVELDNKMLPTLAPGTKAKVRLVMEEPQQ